MFFMQITDEDDRIKAEILYYRYRNLMYKVSYSILQDKYLAEDAINEAFIRIIKNLHKIDEEDCPKTRNFLVIICRNVSINIYNLRNKIKEYEYLEELAEDANVIDPEEVVINKECLGRMAKAISELDDKYRDVLILRRVYDMSAEEVAGMLGITADNVRKRLQRAKKMVLKKYNKGELE